MFKSFTWIFSCTNHRKLEALQYMTLEFHVSLIHEFIIFFHSHAAPKPSNLRPNPHGHPRSPFAGSTGLFNSAGIQNKMDFFTKIYKIDVSDVSAKKLMFVVCLMGAKSPVNWTNPWLFFILLCEPRLEKYP